MKLLANRPVRGVDGGEVCEVGEGGDIVPEGERGKRKEEGREEGETCGEEENRVQTCKEKEITKGV